MREFGIASAAPLRYRCHMRRRLELVRRRNADGSFVPPGGPRASGRPETGLASPCRRSAFSLLELLFVAVILVILSTMYWSATMGSHAHEKQDACAQNLQKICIAMQIYSNDHAGKYPVLSGARTSEEALDALVPRYTADTSLFICPGSDDSALPSACVSEDRRPM